VRDVPGVLFVCVHNAGRSQMAAALLDHHAKDMDEWGIDLSSAFPKPKRLLAELDPRR
jgi:arsenate reductase (thioredoxin)